jgi:hypothetical protein
LGEGGLGRLLRLGKPAVPQDSEASEGGPVRLEPHWLGKPVAPSRPPQAARADSSLISFFTSLEK